MECRVLALAEHLEGKLANVTLQLLTKGRELANQLGAALGVVLLGSHVDPLVEELKDKGADNVLVADLPSLKHYNPEIYTRVVCDIAKYTNPRLILLGYTFSGMELGPAAATRLGYVFAGNCVDLNLANGSFIVTRPVYRGLRHAQLEVPATAPLIVSLQQGAITARSFEARDAEIHRITVQVNEEDCRTRVKEIIAPTAGEIDITQAEIIIAVGRGIKDKANIQLVRDLADALGGVIACSRPLTDIGWLPLEYQVGMSGKTVKPKVYVACGISGASHHLAGMKESELVIAINKDPHAPIFQIAHYGVVGDLFETLPALIQEARAPSAD